MNRSVPDFNPIRVSMETLTTWSSRPSALISLAKVWHRHMPRTKSWFPRFLGRALGRGIRRSIETKRGAQLAVEPTSLDVYAYMLNHERTWNERVFIACASMLSRGDVFYDIGANVGYMSIEMAQVFSDQIKVYAFEPQSNLARSIAISANLNHFKNVCVYDYLLGDREQDAKLFLSAHSVHASLVPRSCSKPSDALVRRMTTIDRMVACSAIPPPSVMKLDVEGGELLVLSGARDTISRHLPAIVFEADSNLSRFGCSRRDVLSYIGNQGNYRFYFLGTGAEDLIEIAESNLMEGRYSDIVALPSSGAN